MHLTLKIMGILSLVGLLGCETDCIKTVQTGDFEFSQGNYKNALRQYEQAWKEDSACSQAQSKIKLTEERMKMLGLKN